MTTNIEMAMLDAKIERIENAMAQAQESILRAALEWSKWLADDAPRALAGNERGHALGNVLATIKQIERESARYTASRDQQLAILHALKSVKEAI